MSKRLVIHATSTTSGEDWSSHDVQEHLYFALDDLTQWALNGPGGTFAAGNATHGFALDVMAVLASFGLVEPFVVAEPEDAAPLVWRVKAPEEIHPIDLTVVDVDRMLADLDEEEAAGDAPLINGEPNWLAEIDEATKVTYGHLVRLGHRASLLDLRQKIETADAS